ncbi:hypothetical protein KAF44_34450 [Cupriavidus necator]|nr:hypothetical protein KAF44_34450 [Cupriavidus necator]
MAYHAGTGDKLWQVPTGSGVVAAPVTYVLDGTSSTFRLQWAGAACMA